MLRGAAHIGPGADSLGRQGLYRPAAAHLIGNDALDVVLPVHYIDDTELSPGDPGVFKAAPVFIEAEPGLGDLALAVRQNGKAPAPLTVKFKEDGGGLRHRHHHAGAAGCDGAAVQASICQGQNGLALRLIAAKAQAVGIGDVGNVTSRVAFRRRSSLFEACVGFRRLRPPGSDDTLALVALIVAAAAKVNGPRRRDGDSSLPGLPHFYKAPAAVIVAEGIAAAHGIFQVGGEHGAAAVAQSHLHGVILQRGSRPAANQNRQQKAQAPTQFFHATSPSPHS